MSARWMAPWIGLVVSMLLLPALQATELSHGPRQTGGALSSSVALVDWQFPHESSPTLPVHPRQRALIQDPDALALRPALYPGLSEESEAAKPGGLARLTLHGTRCAGSYAVGREQFTAPFLLNVSTATPAALRRLIDEGLRIVCFSIGARAEEAPHLAWLEKLVRERPEVLFLVGTPHISGNGISVETLDEVPSSLAGRHENVLLVGALAFYDYQLDEKVEARLGTKENPFHVDNQPSTARQLYMMNPRSTRVFVEGFGGTSAAAPHLASLLSLVAEARIARGEVVDARSLLKDVEALTHRTMAREKSGLIHEVSYFTLDSILLNAGRPLVHRSIWGDFSDRAPAPLRLTR